VVLQFELLDDVKISGMNADPPGKEAKKRRPNNAEYLPLS
jgi:hypothetical protein